jgi:hypothetical protein
MEDEPVLLEKIDKEICEKFPGQFYSEQSYSIMFQLITMIGDESTKSGDFVLRDFHKAVRLCELNEEDMIKVLYFIHGQYRYRSWR